MGTYSDLIMKQRLLQFLLLLSVGISSAVPAFPYDVVVDGIYYNLVCYDGENSVAEVTNNGEWTASYSGDLVIPASIVVNGNNYPVTKIGDDAFQKCSWLSSVTIPESVSSIGWNSQMMGTTVFSSCTNLLSITVAENSQYYKVVDEVLYDYSQYCLLCVPAKYSSTTFTVPSKVRSIEGGAFANCTNLTQVTIPSSITSIGECAFCGCTSLSLVNIPEGINSIPRGMFANCTDITNITIPNNIQTISENAFAGSGIKIIVIPNSTISIESMAFYGCEYLENITLGKSISNIGYDAFNGCRSLSRVTSLNPIPFSLNSNAFQGLDKSNMTLYVPLNSVADYQNADNWKEFGNVEALRQRVEIGSAGKATYCCDFDLDFNDVEGLKAYVATGFNHDNGSILLTRIYKIPSGTGVLLVGNTGTYEIPVADINYTYANLFVGTLEETEVPMTSDGYTHYILANGPSGVMFYKYAGGTLSANKSYLRVPSSEATSDMVKMRFTDDDPTSVDMTDCDKRETDVMYNLKGQRIYKPRKGMYIKNGKTYVE